MLSVKYFIQFFSLGCGRPPFKRGFRASGEPCQRAYYQINFPMGNLIRHLYASGHRQSEGILAQNPLRSDGHGNQQRNQTLR